MGSDNPVWRVFWLPLWWALFWKTEKVVGRGREDLACYILILWLQKVNTVAIISLNHLRYLQLGSLCPISFLLS